MVEAQLIEEPFLRVGTPTQGRYFGKLLHEDFETSRTPRLSPEIYDRSHLSTPTLVAEERDYSSGDIEHSPDSSPGDARGDMSESYRSDNANNRRRSRSQLAAARRSSGNHVSQSQSPSHGYLVSSPTVPTENLHNRPPSGYQGSAIHFPPATTPYSQLPSYVGQYTVSAQPTPMPLAHTPPAYAFPSYHHPGPQDTSMISQNYRPMLQPPHAPSFSYQRHSQDGASSSHATFSGSRNSPMYPSPHHVAPSPSSSSSHNPTPVGQSSAPPTSYVGSGQFQSLRYPSPMSTGLYQYPTQSYSPSPMFSPQYPPPPFSQHYTPTAEPEPQGTWFYLPHAPVPSPQQYDGGPPYQGHYPPVAYPAMGHSEVDGIYGVGQSSTNPSSPIYPISPVPQTLSQYSDGIASSNSPHSSGVGPPNQRSGASGAVGSASSGSGRPVDKPIVRRSYHPNPPAHRSEWVMWAGNVPPDATHDELWRFFNQPQPSNSESTGVLSIFLISRSSCAFVNYENEALLHEGITRFNGVPLRSNDPRCARLVCRVRRKDDDLKAGVGGQRGMGMHTKWVKEQKGKQREAASDRSDVSLSEELSSISPSSVSERMATAISRISVTNDGDDHRTVHAKHSSSSGSFASTNSSFLTRNFPKRYFILKSLTQYDLDLSVERGLWATQKHNEEILDQAFRTSKEVYLVFGVNKSGEFYGYARMSGPVRRGEGRVSWASRPSPSPSRPAQSSPSRSTTAGQTFFSPSDGRLVDNSPLPVDGSSIEKAASVRHSAPALLGEGYRLPTLQTPKTKHSLDHRIQVNTKAARQQEEFELDESAPWRAMRGNADQEKAPTRSGPALQVVEEVEEKERHGNGEVGPTGEEPRPEEVWGECFAIEWISTERLPFHRTRHLRNPWNHDREVKVSRDGTELEPGVGERLLEEWEKLGEPQAFQPMGPGRPAGKRSTGLKHAERPDGLVDGFTDGLEGTQNGEATKGRPSRSR